MKLGGARTFPISRALTAPLSLVETLRGALTGGSLGHTVGGPLGAAVGGSLGGAGGLMQGVGLSLARRRNFAQSTFARLLRGGEGLMEHEKDRLAEGLGLRRARFDQLAQAMKTKHPARRIGAHEDIYSRFANSKYNPMAALERLVDARALAGRLAKREPLLQHERELVSALRARERRERVKDVAGPAAAALAATAGAGAAGYGGYQAYRHVKRPRD